MGPEMMVSTYRLESDAATVIRALCKRSIPCNELRNILWNVCSLLAYFPSINLAFVGRDANKSAHDLVRYSFQIESELIWFEEKPPSIECVIVLDSNR